MQYGGYVDTTVEWMSSAYMVQRYEGCVESMVSGRAWVGRPDRACAPSCSEAVLACSVGGQAYYQDSMQTP